MKDRTAAIGLLAAAAFLAPVIGGHLSVDVVPISPGSSEAARRRRRCRIAWSGCSPWRRWSWRRFDSK